MSAASADTRSGEASGLIRVARMAHLLDLQPGTLQRLDVRRRLEAEGCPRPRSRRPLRWSAAEVMRWIDPAGTTNHTTADRAPWREKMIAAYGESR